MCLCWFHFILLTERELPTTIHVRTTFGELVVKQWPAHCCLWCLLFHISSYFLVLAFFPQTGVFQQARTVFWQPQSSCAQASFHKRVRKKELSHLSSNLKTPRNSDWFDLYHTTRNAQFYDWPSRSTLSVCVWACVHACTRTLGTGRSWRPDPQKKEVEIERKKNRRCRQMK